MSFPETIDLPEEELQAVLDRVKARVDPEDYEILERLAEAARWLSLILEKKKLSLERLQSMLFGAKTEKTKNVIGESEEDGEEARTEEEEGGSPNEGKPPKKKKKRKGHGRAGADDYPGAEKVGVAHGGLASGCACPSCTKGKVYKLSRTSKVVRIVGQPMLPAKIYEREVFRCNLCGEVFTAPLPDGAGAKKYDETVGSMIALLKYGSGLPFHRLEKLQAGFGVPFPASTQWGIVASVARDATPVYEELVRQAAQGEVVHNDDTGMTILNLGSGEDGEAEDDGASDPERTGVFTSGIVSTLEKQKIIALFFTGQKHAGENLGTVLKERAEGLRAPIQMCDGLSRNQPKDFDAIVANCLAHGRRKFVELRGSFPDECRYVLESLRCVYRNDATAKSEGMSPEKRLRFHQASSQKTMDDLHDWLEAQLEEKKVEPNSGLGEAITYMLKRWEPLTLFLREPGAPLDNNVCERALKMAILHRKNAYFYKTERGARVGDLFMSLIHTSRLSGANPFEYLTAIQRNAERVHAAPSEWLPWNYEDALRPPAARAPP